MIVDTTYSPPVADLDAVRGRALRIGIAGLVVCAIGFVVARDHFFRAWLIGFLLWLGVSLGSLALMMIQHLSGGAWGVFRRIFEAASRTLPLMALLFLPVVARHELALPVDARRPRGRPTRCCATRRPT